MPSGSSPISLRTVLLTTFGVAVCFATANWLSATPPQTAPKDPAVARGHQQYLESCAFCHGTDATGGRGPDLLRSALVAHDVKGDKIGEVIHSGRPDKGMPPIPLTDTQIAEVAAYLHARAAAVLESSGVPSDYPLARLLTGNPEEGKKYFAAAGCANCHSVSGDLTRLTTKYSSIELEARMLYPDDKPATAVVTLPSGRQFSGLVRHLDDFVVILRDRQDGQFHSFDRAQVKVEIQDPLAAHRQLLEKITQTEMHDLFAYIASLK